MGTDLGEVETGTVGAIIVVPVHVKDLLALNGQKAGENAFGQTGSKHNDLGGS